MVASPIFPTSGTGGAKDRGPVSPVSFGVATGDSACTSTSSGLGCVASEATVNGLRNGIPDSSGFGGA